MSASQPVRSHEAHLAPELDIRPLRRPVHALQRGVGVLFASLDAAIIVLSGLLSYWLYVRWFDHLSPFFQADFHQRLLGFLACYTALAVLCNAAQNLYSSTVLSSVQLARLRTLNSLLLSCLMTVMLFFLSGAVSVPPFLMGATTFFSIIGVLTVREVRQRRNLKRIARGVGVQHVLIVGAGPVGVAFQQYLEAHPQLGKVFCGFVEDEPNGGNPWLGAARDLPRLVREHFVDEVYFTPESDRALILQTALQAREDGISVKVVPDLYEGLALGASVSHLGNVPVLELNPQPIPASGLLLKRVLDLAVASVLGILLAPLMLLMALIIKFDSPGPVFYTAWRVGRKGRNFLCYKFRTMVVDADARKDKLRHMNERKGATFKISNDPRVTRIGRFLRRYSIDELPQLINVLRGEMSMVGPRPHPVDDYAHYQLADLRRLDVLPGITGLWQVSARQDPSFQKNVLLDLEYIQNWTLRRDLKILLQTIPEVLRGTGH